MLHAEAFRDLGFPAMMHRRPQLFYQKHFQNGTYCQRQWPRLRPTLQKTTLAAKERSWCPLTPSAHLDVEPLDEPSPPPPHPTSAVHCSGSGTSSGAPHVAGHARSSCPSGIFVNSFPQECSFGRMVEQSVENHVLQSVEEIVEGVRLFPHERFQLWRRSQICPVLRPKSRSRQVNVFPQGRLFVRLGEQDNFRSQCVEEVVEVMQVLLQKAQAQCGPAVRRSMICFVRTVFFVFLRPLPPLSFSCLPTECCYVTLGRTCST